MKAFIKIGQAREEIHIPKEETLNEFIVDLKNYMYSFANEQGAEHDEVKIEFG